MIYREIEGKTIYLMLSKPLDRGMILSGKFIGFSVVLIGMILGETLLLAGLLDFRGFPPDIIFWISV